MVTQTTIGQPASGDTPRDADLIEELERGLQNSPVAVAPSAASPNPPYLQECLDAIDKHNAASPKDSDEDEALSDVRGTHGQDS